MKRGYFMTNLTFDWQIDEFMVYCQSKQLRPKSMQSYEQALRLFERWCMETRQIENVDEVKGNDVRRYITDVQQRGKYTLDLLSDYCLYQQRLSVPPVPLSVGAPSVPYKGNSQGKLLAAHLFRESLVRTSATVRKRYRHHTLMWRRRTVSAAGGTAAKKHGAVGAWPVRTHHGSRWAEGPGFANGFADTTVFREDRPKTA